jgi:hypothetical protein
MRLDRIEATERVMVDVINCLQTPELNDTNLRALRWTSLNTA